MKAEKLNPVCKNYIWGGTKLSEKYGKDKSTVPCAESWELSFHNDGLCRLDNGHTLSDDVSAEELGENCKKFSGFPMLIKLIDAKNDLSVQVHPSDEYAMKAGLGYGKTEMWYVVEAEPGACLYIGFNKEVTENDVRAAIEDKTLPQLLNKVEVKPGDAYFIPAGTVHAIGAGCLICEIQQNSNITYRLYDYGRKDKDGKERELHIDKALAVLNRGAYTSKRQSAKTNDGTLIFANKYFSAYELEINGEHKFSADKGSFRCLTCVKGNGELNSKAVKTGDSFFIPANLAATAKGEMTVIISTVRRYAVGIDLGGTFIKGGIADDASNIIVSDKIPTCADGGSAVVAERIASLCLSLLDKAGLTRDDVCGIGMGVPGMINSEKGEVVYANNLGWVHFNIADAARKMTGLEVKTANDANVAALGEAVFGAGKGCRNVVMLTLGTGVGGGLILDRKLYEGNGSAGAELGHFIIRKGGEPCTCGRRGCFEAYASATALVRNTKRAIEAHPDSKMAEATEVDGRTAFIYREVDKYAAQVIDEYFDDLAAGITDIANVFRPEKILIGGGISGEGEKLEHELQARLDKEIYAGDMGPKVKIQVAALGNRAGLLGAAALAFAEIK